jgi:arginine/ornithine transport system permease protein
MTYMAKQASAATRQPFVFLLFTALLFLLFTSLSLWGLRKLNDRYSLGSKRVILL